ncbi:MAG TPA: type II toxin-antitoxin system VapC family toxin [Falsiroseomonas sp.]|nr:type II toxin-antitoxin system VapC family toxin [Falsiroseomonas sp.]
MTAPGYVLDASVVIKMVVAEPGSDAARRLRGLRLAAPDLIWAECANILWKAVRRGILEAPQAELACATLLRLPFEVVPSAGLLPAALQRAVTLDHPACDCLYLELAATLGLPLVTADRRLRLLASPEVQVIGLDDLA